MTKGHTVGEVQYLAPGIFEVHKDALDGFISHAA
jgi:alpha-D-ribose 1-methylphosphonate 5-triphosphate diphosphatase PhnM